MDASPALTTSLFLLSLAAASCLPRLVNSSIAGEKDKGMPNTFLQQTNTLEPSEQQENR